ncbi:MAG TPA: GNAT family N-acetyltransferase, partial [Terracidiphilus sp.]
TATYTWAMLETRLAVEEDAALIASHRCAMFATMGRAEQSVLDDVRRASEPWTARMMREGKYLGWITTDDGRPIASAGMLILDWPPHPFDPTGERRAYLLNVFVDADYRRRGLARTLLELCLAEARRRDIRVVSLHASDEGRALYRSLGFHPSNEMMLADAKPKI